MFLRQNSRNTRDQITITTREHGFEVSLLPYTLGGKGNTGLDKEVQRTLGEPILLLGKSVNPVSLKINTQCNREKERPNVI